MNRALRAPTRSASERFRAARAAPGREGGSAMTDTLHTGEFNPGIGWRGNGNAVSIFQNTVWVIGAGGGSSHPISITTFDVEKTAADWNVMAPTGWTSGRLDISGGYEAQTWGRPASEVLGGNALYLFWAARHKAILPSSTNGP